MIAVGNQTGKIFCWDLEVNHPSNAKYDDLFILADFYFGFNFRALSCDKLKLYVKL